MIGTFDQLVVLPDLLRESIDFDLHDHPVLGVGHDDTNQYAKPGDYRDDDRFREQRLSPKVNSDFLRRQFPMWSQSRMVTALYVDVRLPIYQVTMFFLLCSFPSGSTQRVMIVNFDGVPIAMSIISSKHSPGSNRSKGSLSCINA